MSRAGIYARVSTNDQQTLAMQNRAMREYAGRRGWMITLQVREVGSGAAMREARERLLEAARRREIDVVLVWRLDRWGRSVTDLLATLQELNHLGVGFVSLTEALDLTTPAGRSMAGLLAIFAEFEREVLREELGLAWRRLGRMVNAWAGRKRRRGMPTKSESYVWPAPASPRLPDVCRSGAPPCAASWEQGHEKSQARSSAGRPHPQRSDRQCSSRRAGNELVLLSGKQNLFPVPGEVCSRERRLAAQER
jgi:DNA invertase Pin-like site-specific DNA recombinase